VKVSEQELKRNALRAANGRSFSRSWRLGWLWEWAKVLPPAVVLFLLVRTMLVEAFKIPSGSMENTLLVGDFLLVNKVVYGAGVPFTDRHLPAVRPPRHGDVVVFAWPVDPSKSFVKRLVGLAGDTLSMQDGVLVRNGRPVSEPYVPERGHGAGDAPREDFSWQRSYLVQPAVAALSEYHPSRDRWGPLVVPPAHLFVLGDNRENSLDSRYWGFVPDSLLRGTPLVVYYSYTPDSSVTLPWLSRIRWTRVGAVVR